jgi:hypothetical protein
VFGSLVVEATLAVLLKEPPVALTVPMIVMVCVEELAILAKVHWLL